MRYLSYYGLSFNPFDKQMVKEKDMYESQDIKTMLDMLNYLKDTRGIGLFTAKPGMGKSFALRCFAKNLNQNLYHMEYFSLTTLSVSEFYKKFCSVLGLDSRGGKPVMFDAIQKQIDYLYDKRQPLLLAIDEAQYLSSNILTDIKLLMNSEFDSVNKFTLILSGEPYLNNTFRKPIHEALRQRVTVHYDFQGLSDKEISEYIHHKILSAGGSVTIIDPSALSAVHSHSQGNPRLIDNYMSDALMLGAQKEKKIIDADVIMSVVNNRNI